MEYVEAPDIWEGVVCQKDGRSIFLAGGITGCPDWQHEFRAMFVPPPGYPAKFSATTLLNPRRFEWDDTIDARQQILWERLHINAASEVVVWFPKETVCPITLFELGTLLAVPKPVRVGCHPDYARRVDLEVQIPLLRTKGFSRWWETLTISSSLEDLFERVTK